MRKQLPKVMETIKLNTNGLVSMMAEKVMVVLLED